MTDIIERPAGDKSKGFDTQVFRAILLILDKINNGSEQVYCALEIIEDVFVKETTPDGVIKTTLEEDKNYSTSFSFRSEPVRNTLVSFFDQYMLFDQDPNLALCFYAQTVTANEVISKKDTENIDGLKKEHQGKKSILISLINDEPIEDDSLEIALRIFQKEYNEQYSNRKDKKVGHTSIVSNLTLESFREFITSINWTIKDEDNSDIEELVIEKIKASEFFDYKYEGREKSILHNLFYEFTLKKSNRNFISKLMSKDSVENIYLKSLLGNKDTLSDSSWKTWKDISTSDLRSLDNKIMAVCPDYRKKRIDNLYRKVGIAKSEEKSLGRDYMSLKARVLSTCEDIIAETLDDEIIFTKKSVNEVFKQLEEKSIETVNVLKQDYSYNASNEKIIIGMIYSLFDECYLALDEL